MQCEDTLREIRGLVNGALAYQLTAPQDGSDVTDILNTQMRAIPNGSWVILPPGRYRCEGTFRPATDRHELMLDAGGAVLYATSIGPLDAQGRSTRKQVVVHGSTSITIRGLRTEGWDVGYQADGFASPYAKNREFEHGFEIAPVGYTDDRPPLPCTDILLDGVEVRDVSGDGIYVGSALSGPQGARVPVNSEQVTIRDVLIEKTGRQGIGVVSALGLTVEGSIVVCNRTAVDIENIAGTISDVAIRNNFLFAGNGAVNGMSSSVVNNNVLIEGNVCRGPGIRESGTSPHRIGWTIRHNVWPGPAGSYSSDQMEGPPFWLLNTDGLTVHNNYFRSYLKRRHNRTKNGALKLGGDTQVSITDNDFRGQNGLIQPGTQDMAEVTEADNVGIWVGPIAVNQPYPPEYDPDVDRTYTLETFPQLDPTAFDTAGHWDGMVRNTGIV